MGELIRDFGGWLYAVVTSLAAYLTGGIVVLIWLIYERIKKQNISLRAFVAGMIVFLFVSFFSAWREQKKAAQSATQMIDGLRHQLARVEQELADTKRTLTYEREQNKPKFEGSIDWLVMGDSPDINSAQVFVVLTVRNTGAPSIVEGDWKLTIRFGDSVYTASPIFIPDGYKLQGQHSEVARFTRDMAFEDKAAKPVDRGSKITGWLRYPFQDIKMAELNRIGTTLELGFTDILKEPYIAKFTVEKGSDDQLRYNPGAGAPFRSLDKRIVPNSKP
jgi:hypothetical protein